MEKNSVVEGGLDWLVTRNAIMKSEVCVHEFIRLDYPENNSASGCGRISKT